MKNKLYFLSLAKDIVIAGFGILALICFSKEWFWLTALCLVVGIALYILIRGYVRQCPECHKWNKMQTMGKQLLDTSYSGHNKVKTYDVQRKCKECGFEDRIVRKVTRRVD